SPTCRADPSHLLQLTPPLPVFSLMLPRPPRSPLFPYTTLFRSVGVLVTVLLAIEVASRFPVRRLWLLYLALLAALAVAWVVPERSEEHTSELQSLRHLVCRLLLEKKKKKY